MSGLYKGRDEAVIEKFNKVTVESSMMSSSDLSLDVKKKGSEKESTLSVTVAVVTSDIRKPYARKCVALLKEFTEAAELLVLDNNGKKPFSHPVEMNRILKSVETDFLVLLDDDVYVGPRWLEGLLKCIDEKTAVVTPVHRDRNNAVSYSGIYITEEAAQGEHLLDMPQGVREVQTYCSAIMLLDLRKIGHIFMNTNYKKYFFDQVHGLEVWETGFKVLCTPEVVVTHLSGATSKRFSSHIEQLYGDDRATFIKEWISSGRLSKLEEGIWHQVPLFREHKEIAEKIGYILQGIEQEEGKNMEQNLDKLMEQVKEYNIYRNLLIERLDRYRASLTEKGAPDRERIKMCTDKMDILISSVPSRGGTAIHPIERAAMRVLIALLGPSRYLRMRKDLGIFLRKTSH